MWCVHASAQSDVDWTPNIVWQIVTSRSLFVRSTSTPAYSEKTTIGSDWQAATSPTRNAFRVSANASHPSAIACIQVPMSDSVCPDQNSRKLRCRRARNGLKLAVIGTGQSIHIDLGT